MSPLPGRIGAALMVMAMGQVSVATAQTLWQADLRIQAIEITPVGGYVNIRVVLYSDHDESARNTSLHLFFPVGTKVARLAPGCRSSPGPSDAGQARVDCELGEIRVRDSREITIVATAPVQGAVGRFAAFAYSDTPDPLITNNYAERVLPRRP